MRTYCPPIVLPIITGASYSGMSNAGLSVASPTTYDTQHDLIFSQFTPSQDEASNEMFECYIEEHSYQTPPPPAVPSPPPAPPAPPAVSAPSPVPVPSHCPSPPPTPKHELPTTPVKSRIRTPSPTPTQIIDSGYDSERTEMVDSDVDM